MPVQSTSDLLPLEWAREVVQETAQQSAVMSLSQRRTLSTRTSRIPATALLAGAGFVAQGDGDSTGLKPEQNVIWKGVNLVVEEVAALVGIPHAYEQDSGFPVWDETRPMLVEAIGAAVDAAALFGINKPSTWPTDIVTAAVAAGNNAALGVEDDIAKDISESARRLKETGFTTTGFATEPGFGWRLIGLRSDDGVPIYQRDLAGSLQSGLYGFPMVEVANGAWNSALATVIHGDWKKSIVGIRQDISFSKHDSGVISNDEGVVTFNAMQQDASIWRAVIRLAWAVADPATRLGPNPGQDDGKYPFAVIGNAS